jgi:tetratricopeptide (TPR) repeat protein
VDHPSSEPLTVEAARRRLGLGKDDRLADYLPHWKEVEMRLAGMAAEAKDPAARASFEKDLAELRDVLRMAAEEPEAASAKATTASSSSSSGKGFFLWTLILALLAGGGYFGYQEWTKSGLGDRKVTVNLRETEDRFDEALENRRWDDAENIVALMQAEGVDEEKVKASLAKVKKSRVEERGQQIAFLISNAESALEAGQLSEAEGFCSEVEKLKPDHSKIPKIREVIKESKMQVRSVLMVKSIEEAMDEENWEVAKNQLESLINANPAHPKVPEIRKRIAVAEETMVERRAEASVLIAKAKELDKGTYSPEALDLVEQAMHLYPSKENRELYQRMSSYGKVLRVPSEHGSITAALKKAEKNDRVLVSNGIYQESLIVPTGVELFGESRSDTIIECPAGIGSVISVEPGSRDVRVSSLTLRHTGLVNDEERFPILAVDGGDVEIDDLTVTRASGHGIAVIDGGNAVITQSKVTDCGWDGISVTGEGSYVVLNQVTSEKNLHHGVDFWEGASGTVKGSVFTANGRSGLLAIAPAKVVTVDSTRAEGNREVGFFFSEMVGVIVTNCAAHENLLGGMFFERSSKGIELLNNSVTKNGEAGIVFEKGVEILNEEGNTIDGNDGKQVWKDAVFPARAQEETVSPPPPPPPLEVAVENKPS